MRKRNELTFRKRKSRFHKRRAPKKPILFRRDPNDPKQLILLNGTRIRQGVEGVGLYASRGGRVYSLTSKGLREIRINYCRNNHYGRRTKGGNRQGQRYPYVKYKGKTYRVHFLVAFAWIGPKPEKHVLDHINGDIDDCRLVNLRFISKEENNRCGGILRKLRNAAVRLKDPSLNPANIPQSRLLIIFATITPCDPNKIMDDDFKYHREF